MGRWGDGGMGSVGDGECGNPPLAPPPPRRGMWGDRERFGNGARMEHFWRW
ncbi:hypothetical protein [Okeania sp. SIO2B3]|uniref:hypothetical protein n=1 Tax=Okeania sp. SIO2B3 TaxID=2607784 RepID=UPI0013BF53A6|nr:hypothetical protein [Okeania sp. SIO2B3]NET40779.1 hypothetical protein [Okeania sp. SIO2B3]